MALARAKKAYKTVCMWHAIAQGAKRIDAESLHVHITFFKPSRRAMDLDNCLSQMKAGLDGLAEVLGVDDSKWTLAIEFAPDIGGWVRVRFTPALEVTP